ncbi:protein YIPF6 [Chelonus insularis]|uniref:protein YIPF6 n=1 Tax=Chelonus insularis TaxID=460826 RepID=UPI001589AB43|nr:protein YIPF6 [Chelonus insularis]XP_034943615.1 protein YIPF6 [Chelonus insularis]
MLDDSEYVINTKDIEGEMTIKNMRNEPHNNDFSINTLDEPVKDTILRDLKIVGKKFHHVINPKEKKSLLKEWDLWGPLLLCTFLAMILQGHSDKEVSNDGGPEFAEVFVIVWNGSIVVTLNSKLLGGNISFFQNICVLGYCLLPISIALIFCKIILLFEQTIYLFILRVLCGVIGFLWAIYASTTFLSESHPVKRKALAVYPMFLFYLIMSWLVISHTG